MEEKGTVHKLHAKNIEICVDGYWLRHYAEDFLSAAITFDVPKNRFSPIPYYLICHSIELSLKSYLFTAGFSKKDRKKMSHDLVHALREAQGNGIGHYIVISSMETEAVFRANQLYSRKEFEYFESLETIYDPHDFDIEVLKSLARRLIESIENPVYHSIHS